MPEYEYSSKDKAFIKECSSCKTIYMGTDERDESEAIFAKAFDKARRATDGLQSRCKVCHSIHRKRSKGVDDHDPQAMFEDQNGLCCLCEIQLHLPYRYSADPQGARVDHDHKTGRVRGLLCHTCNTMLGMYEALLERRPMFDINDITLYLSEGQ